MKQGAFDKLREYLPDGQVKLAVGVSGGADSLALVMILHQAGYQVIALTVDHGLRPESADEALYVGQLMGQWGIEHYILTLDTAVGRQNLQAKAREARYKALVNWCESHQVWHLCVAHHQEDQAETFLMRLARGSGVKGLQAMQPVVQLSDKVTLYRPLLSTPKQVLKDFLNVESIQWIEDPSNQNKDFDRIKLRDFLNHPPLEGFTAERLSQTAATMQRAQQALDFYTDQWLHTYVDFNHVGFVTLKKTGLQSAPAEIIFRALSALMIHMTGKAYAPRFSRLSRLYDDMQKPDFQAATLGGVVITAPAQENGDFILYREYAAMRPVAAVAQTRFEGLFDLSISAPILVGDYIAPLGDKGWAQLKAGGADQSFWHDLSHAIRLTVPVIWSSDGTVKYAPYWQNTAMTTPADSMNGMNISPFPYQTVTKR